MYNILNYIYKDNKEEKKNDKDKDVDVKIKKHDSDDSDDALKKDNRSHSKKKDVDKNTYYDNSYNNEEEDRRKKKRDSRKYSVDDSYNKIKNKIYNDHKTDEYDSYAYKKKSSYHHINREKYLDEKKKKYYERRDKKSKRRSYDYSSNDDESDDSNRSDYYNERNKKYYKYQDKKKKEKEKKRKRRYHHTDDYDDDDHLESCSSSSSSSKGSINVREKQKHKKIDSYEKERKRKKRDSNSSSYSSYDEDTKERDKKRKSYHHDYIMDDKKKKNYHKYESNEVNNNNNNNNNKDMSNEDINESHETHETHETRETPINMNNMSKENQRICEENKIEKEKEKISDVKDNTTTENNNLSRLERLKLFARKIKKTNDTTYEKHTKFTLNTKVNKITNLNIFMNDEDDDIDNSREKIFDMKNENNIRIQNVDDNNYKIDIKKKKEEKNKNKINQNRKMKENHKMKEENNNNSYDNNGDDLLLVQNNNTNEDALDLYMKEIEEAWEEENKNVKQTITLDEIYTYDMNKHKYEHYINPKNNEEIKEDNRKEKKDNVEKENIYNNNNVNTQEDLEKTYKNNNKTINTNNNYCDEYTHCDDEDTFHKLFIEELKKKTEEDMKRNENDNVNEFNLRDSKNKKLNKELSISFDSSDDTDNREECLSSNKSELNYEENGMKKMNKKILEVNHDEIDYVPIKKNIYVQVKEITNMKDSDVEMFRKNNGNIIVRGKNCPRPIQYFYQCGLPSKILQILERKNFKKMYNIQMQTIPALMCGRDVIAIAETGSGKTLSYLFPLIRHVLHQEPLRNNDGPISIILTPTRELSIQVKNEAKIYCKAVDIDILAVYGGSNISRQLKRLKKGVEILVGTPGRIIDILTVSNCKVTNLNRVSFVVLDEADRLLDLGFESQIYNILRNCRKDKQTAMISATFPNYIQNMAKKLLYKPIEIIVGEKGKTNNNIYQFVEIIEESKKVFRLLKLLGEWINYGLILIFVNKQIEADLLYLELYKYDYNLLVLHGGQNQTDRQYTLEKFKKEENKILIATSVMARGIDIKNIILVINYQCPYHIEDYIHRIGRTGRSNNIGYAYTFILPDEYSKAYDIYNLLKNNIYYLNKTIDIPQELENMIIEYTNINSINEKQKAKYKNLGYKGKGYKFTPDEKSRQQIDIALAKKELGYTQENDDKENIQLDDELVDNLEHNNNIDSNENNLDYNKNFNNSQDNKDSKNLYTQHNIHNNNTFEDKNVAGSKNMNKKNYTNDKKNTNNQFTDITKVEQEIQRIKMNDTMELSLKAKKINELMKTYNFLTLQENHDKILKNAQYEEFDKIAEKEALKATEHIEDEKEKKLIFNKTKEDIKNKLIQNKIQSDTMNQSIQRNMLLSALRTKNMKKYSPYLPHTYITEDNNILEEFYINNYPQHVRLKISHKDVLAKIADMSGATCQIKGQYSNPSQPNKQNFLLDTKQLHIEIIAHTYNQIQIARNELNSLLNTFMISCNIKGKRGSTGWAAPQ